jgi:predicted secreted protein
MLSVDGSTLGDTLDVEVSKPFEIYFVCSPSGGYLWECTTRSMRYVYTPKQSIGGGTVVSYLFVFDAVGDYPLKFMYKRVWENEVKRTIEVTIHTR